MRIFEIYGMVIKSTVSIDFDQRMKWFKVKQVLELDKKYYGNCSYPTNLVMKSFRAFNK